MGNVGELLEQVDVFSRWPCGSGKACGEESQRQEVEEYLLRLIGYNGRCSPCTGSQFILGTE